MSILDSRLEAIEDNISLKKEYQKSVVMIKRMVNSLRPYNIIEDVRACPNDLLGGSVTLNVKTLPKDVQMKVWHDSNQWYFAFFKSGPGNFTQLIDNTFNKEGVMVIAELEEVEKRLLDFLANEVYNRDKEEVIS
jgi:hypothetical protein